MRLPRRIRGILGIALTWTAGWGILGAVLGNFTVPVWVETTGRSPITYIALVALSGAGCGFISGVAFSLFLLLAERKRTIYQLSLLRAAVWGGLGAMVLFMPQFLLLGVSPGLALVAAVFGSAGASSAAATLLAARRGLIAPPGEKRRIGMAAEP